jgi:Phosphoribosylaminoimidazolesuccinocarboxamide (SAICAR) synthase
MTGQEIEAALGRVFSSLDERAAGGRPLYKGKVRDVVSGPEALLLVASDRISAFDRVLSTVPFKGEVLSRVSAWWFERCADIVGTHVLPDGDPVSLGVGRATLVRKVEMLPLEVVVRGYLTGSAWRDYSSGGTVSGISLPQGLSRSQRFPTPIITPSTKEEGGHDKPISSAEIVSSGLVPSDLWHEVETASLALFARGQELAARSGLILVDTKYEFGVADGKLVLADELHSPDSSRYWWADGYESRFASSDDQRELDKEPFRRWLAERGFMGEGSVPGIPDAVRIETALRYVQAYEAITGENFSSIGADPQAETQVIARIVSERL